MTKSKKSTPTQTKEKHQIRSTKSETKKSATVLCIDPGFDRLGIAIMTLENSRPSVLFSECVKTSTKESRAERLLVIGRRISEIIHEWKPEHLAIETLFFNQNITSGIGVAEARGVALFEAAKAGLMVHEYSPQAIKIATTSYGKAGKREIDTMVRRLVSLPKGAKKIDDEIDAIAVGITHLASKKDF